VKTGNAELAAAVDDPAALAADVAEEAEAEGVYSASPITILPIRPNIRTNTWHKQ
jgi:hypothetical protein